MNATELSRALSSHAEEVCRRYLPAGTKQGRYWICGNARGAPGRSMHVRLAPPGVPGKWTDEATGERGDLLDLIRISIKACELRDAIVEGHRFLALPVRESAPAYHHDADPLSDTSASARRIWGMCREIADTHADRYLRARCIACRAFPTLRFHPALYHRDEKVSRKLPAMVAAVFDNNGAFKGIHRTWLDPRQPRKATLASPRKALGRLHGHAVRFGAAGPGQILVVGEGIETVLSITTALPGVPTAATLAANHLSAFQPPPDIARLIIARDADEDGLLAASRLRRRCAELDIDAVIATPRLGDFNDDLQQLGRMAIAEAIAPLMNAE